MTQEEKDLLLKDLCARLPYGVKISYEAVLQVPEGEVLESIDVTTNIVSSKSVVADFEDVKPYLFPLSSMTEEQQLFYSTHLNYMPYYQRVDWFNKHHLDYRGLIEKD